MSEWRSVESSDPLNISPLLLLLLTVCSDAVPLASVLTHLSDDVKYFPLSSFLLSAVDIRVSLLQRLLVW